MDDMNDFGSWSLGSIYYKQLRGVVDMKDFMSWTQDFRGFEQVRAMNCLVLWMT